MPVTQASGGYLLAIAGATSGSTGFVVKVSDIPLAVEQHGQPLLPLELPEDALYLAVRELCSSLHAEVCRVFGESSAVAVARYALSGRTTERGLHQLASATNDSTLGPIATNQVEWLTRGEACRYASLNTGDTLIVKVGTVAFAHAFMRQSATPSGGYRVGGWGLLSGDDGGGYGIGRHLLYRLFEEHDGRRPRTAFSQRMKALMDDEDVVSLTRWIRGHRIDDTLRTEVSRLAQIAIHLAEEEEDIFCDRLLRKAAAIVGLSCGRAIQGLRNINSTFAATELSVFFQGRLLQYSPRFASYVCKAVRRNVTKLGLRILDFQPLSYVPAVGCIIHGLRTGWGFSEAEISRVLETLESSENCAFRTEFVPQVRALIAAEAGQT